MAFWNDIAKSEPRLHFPASKLRADCLCVTCVMAQAVGSRGFYACPHLQLNLVKICVSSLAVFCSWCCSFLSASQSPLDPFEQWALEDKYASLCNFVVHISMDGFAQGAASKWRHTEGLRGSITCAEDLLKDLASQCRSNAV